MISVPIHKRHKSALKHSKTIYVFTSGGVIVNVQIHRRKKFWRGWNDRCKVDINTGAQQDLRFRAARLMKRVVCTRTVEMLLYGIMSWFP